MEDLYFSLQSIMLIILIIFINFTHTKKSSKTSTKKLPQPQGGWPIIGHLHHLGGKTTIHRTLSAMADKYGSIFSLKLGQQKAVVLSSKEIVQDCFYRNDANIATRPQLALSKHLAYNHAAFAISPYGKYWRDIRKLSTIELLSTKRLEKMKHVRNFEVDYCIKNLHKECKNSNKNCKIPLSKWFQYTSFNISISMIVGKKFSPKMYDEKSTFASKFMELIGRATYFSGVPIPSDFIPFIEWLDINGYIKCMKDIHKDIDMIIGNWLDEKIERRKNSKDCGIEDGDFMDVMLSNIAEGAVMSGYSRETVIKATTLTLLLTGSESTSITLTWAISLLLNNPEALKEAQEELDNKVGREKWVQESDITNLPYLQAIVKETLRLYPPSPLMGPREAMEDCYIDGYFIPKGTRIIVNIWKVHRDPRIWAKPNEFQPKRFLEEHQSINFRAQSYEYFPFSIGRRACPGMNFGLQVVHLMLAHFIQGFDIWTEDGGPVDMSEDLGLALPKASPLDVIIAPRLPIKMYEAL